MDMMVEANSVTFYKVLTFILEPLVIRNTLRTYKIVPLLDLPVLSLVCMTWGTISVVDVTQNLVAYLEKNTRSSSSLS